MLQKLLPENIAPGAHRSFSGRPLQNDNVLDLIAGIVQGLIDDLFQVGVLAFAIGHVGGKD